MTPLTPDDLLVERIATGDQIAMKALFGAHHVRVYRFVLRLLSREDLAEEVAADVFMDVWRQAANFERRSSVSTWLLTIARHKAASALGRSQQRPFEQRAAETRVDLDGAPDERARRRSRADVLRACLAELSAEHREIIDLVYYHEKSIADVGWIVGIPENAVKTRMFHARKRLSDLCRAAGLDIERPGVPSEREPHGPEASLPWYGSGSVPSDEAPALKAALADDPELRAHLPRIEEERNEAIGAAERIAVPSARLAERLFTAIEADRAAEPWLAARITRLFARLGERVALQAPRRLGVAAALAGLAILVEAGIIGAILVDRLRPVRYVGGAGPGETAVAGTFVLVAFQPAARAEQIEALLAATGARVVDGPRAGGLYRLRIGDAGMRAEQQEAVVMRLKSTQDVVQLVAPAK